MFLQESVYTVLIDGFIEARLHMDGLDKIGAKKDAANKVARDEYSKSVAMPTFVVVDPKTRKALGRIRGMRSAQAFLEFLAMARDKAPGQTPKQPASKTGKAGEKVGKAGKPR